MRRVLNSRIFKIIYTIFIIVFMIIISLYLLVILLQGKNLFGYSIYIMPDNSMKNYYQKNDVLVTQKIDKLILELGNDVVYYGVEGGLENRLIIHRIIKIDDKNKKEVLFTTQAIKSPIPDPAIKKNIIKGKVIGKLSFLTILVHLIKSQLGSLLIVFLPLIIILTIEIIKTSIALRREWLCYTTPMLLEDIQKRGKNDKKRKKNKK